MFHGNGTHAAFVLSTRTGFTRALRDLSVADGGIHRLVAALGPAPDAHKSARDLDETQ